MSRPATTGIFDTREELISFLKENEGLSYRELGRLTGLCPATIKSIILGKSRPKGQKSVKKLPKRTATEYRAEAIMACRTCKLDDCHPSDPNCNYNSQFKGIITTDPSRMKEGINFDEYNKANRLNIAAISQACDKVMEEMGISVDSEDFTKGACA